MTSRPLVFLGIVIIVIAALAGVGYVMNKPSPTNEPTIEPVTATTSPIVEIPPPTAGGATSTPFSIPLPASSTADTASWQIYVDKTAGYSLEYPSDLVRDNTSGILTLVFPKNTYFHWPLLDDAKVTVTVVATCPTLSGGGMNGTGTPEKITFYLNGNTFTRSIGSDVGAGQLYTEIAYDTKSKGKCYHLSFLDHATNGAGFYVDDASLIKKYDAQHALDLAKVIDIFGGMIKTLKILAPSA